MGNIKKSTGTELERDTPVSPDELGPLPGIRRVSGLQSETQRKARGMVLEQFISFDDGLQVEGVYRGRGGDAEVNARQEGKSKQKLPTFIVQVTETVALRFIGSANLLGQLDGTAPGTHVVITRTGSKKIGAQTVTQFAVEKGKVMDLEGWSPSKLPQLAAPNGAQLA